LKKGFRLKSLSLIFALAAAAAGSAFAQDNGNSGGGKMRNTQLVILEVDTQSAEGSPLNNNDILVSLALGVPYKLIQGEKIFMPSILATADYVLPVRIWGSHFSVGALLGYTATKVDHITYDPPDGTGDKIPWTTHYQVLALGGRIAYHFNLGIKKLDPYLSAGGIVLFAIATGTDTDNFEGHPLYINRPKAQSKIGFIPALSAGVRYFVTPVIGLFAELGWNDLALVNIGVSYKF